MISGKQREDTYIRENILKNITEEKESHGITTPEKEEQKELVTFSSEMVKIESSEQRSNKSTELANLVTKANIGLPFGVNSKQEWVPETVVHEQGQNSVEEEKEDVMSSLKHKNKDEGRINKYIEKDLSNSIGSINKSDLSQNNSPEESPRADENEAEGEEHQSELHKAHLIQTLQAIQYIRTLNDHFNLDGKYVNLPDHPKFDSPETTKTIIFDLDETLVHCVDEPETDNPHVILKVTFPNGETVDAGINIRPYAIECLKVSFSTKNYRKQINISKLLCLLPPTNHTQMWFLITSIRIRI